jgi:hypothetical protein
MGYPAQVRGVAREIEGIGLKVAPYRRFNPLAEGTLQRETGRFSLHGAASDLLAEKSAEDEAEWSDYGRFWIRALAKHAEELYLDFGGVAQIKLYVVSAREVTGLTLLDVRI